VAHASLIKFSRRSIRSCGTCFRLVQSRCKSPFAFSEVQLKTKMSPCGSLRAMSWSSTKPPRARQNQLCQGCTINLNFKMEMCSIKLRYLAVEQQDFSFSERKFLCPRKEAFLLHTKKIPRTTRGKKSTPDGGTQDASVLVAEYCDRKGDCCPNQHQPRHTPDVLRCKVVRREGIRLACGGPTAGPMA
jgi:hypothetical protein